ncbi:serine/threonine-protein kinase [Umezawaea beigongshangensis]|uniref:serine/threonine-protein kinase n=1 Tax=Umezawaea beigongshangensis TaxID=2780383 RepID=UPI0018F23543|nr:serine/threonine-protein kinase [Umezawaea beigongshangensis]
MDEVWDGELTGQVVAGRYRLLGLLGSGGMAEVYLARDVVVDRDVAVKVFATKAAPADQVRLDREAQVLRSLSAPGVVAVYGTGSHQGRPFYVMQAIGGGTLRSRMYQPLEPEFVARVGCQVARTLAHVHSRGVVHRDVKPSNVLLDDECGQAYLADFGLALQAHATRLTGSGFLVGTAGYLAPEQLRGVQVGGPADVYGLGLVLLECLTGRPEYPGGDAESALARLSRPPAVPTELPDPWPELLTAMTDSDPAMRPSAAECADVLATAVETSTGLAALALADPVGARLDVTADLEVPPRRARRAGLLLAGATAAAGTVLVLGLSGVIGSSPPATGESGAKDQPETTQVVDPVGETTPVVDPVGETTPVVDPVGETTQVVDPVGETSEVTAAPQPAPPPVTVVEQAPPPVVVEQPAPVEPAPPQITEENQGKGKAKGKNKEDD